jgi:hypothetical protein
MATIVYALIGGPHGANQKPGTYFLHGIFLWTLLIIWGTGITGYFMVNCILRLLKKRQNNHKRPLVKNKP